MFKNDGLTLYLVTDYDNRLVAVFRDCNDLKEFLIGRELIYKEIVI